MGFDVVGFDVTLGTRTGAAGFDESKAGAIETRRVEAVVGRDLTDDVGAVMEARLPDVEEVEVIVGLGTGGFVDGVTATRAAAGGFATGAGVFFAADVGMDDAMERRKED